MIPNVSDLGRAPVHPALWALAGAMALVEVMFWAASRGLVDPHLGRHVVYAYFAFHDPLFEAARQDGVITLQLLWSLLTYALLHGGWLHLGFNAAALLGLGHAVSRSAGIGPCFAVIAVTAVAGAVVFGLIAETYAPLVGASGSVFGLLAIITAWQEQMLRRQGLSRAVIWQRIAGLVLLNVVLGVGLGGMLAWEAHLGGFVAGWLMASVYPPRLWRMEAY